MIDAVWPSRDRLIKYNCQAWRLKLKKDNPEGSEVGGKGEKKGHLMLACDSLANSRSLCFQEQQY